MIFKGSGGKPMRLAAASLTFWAVVLFAAPPAGAIPRHASMVIDGNTGAVLHDQMGDEPRHPASLTKMMTLYVVFDLIDQGRLSYDTKIRISAKAAAVAPSKLDLDPGEEITVLDGIKALVTKSANDVAVAFAEEISGTEPKFAELMTARAREIGMKKTTFKNASGLPDPAQISTCRDMITLALRLQDDYPKHYALFSTTTFDYGGATYRNHNTLLRTFKGTDGIKTGYTRGSGFNLVTSVRADGKHLVGVVFGGHSAHIRNANMRLILTKALDIAATDQTRPKTVVAKLAPKPKPARAKPPAAPAQTAPPAETVVADAGPAPPAPGVAVAKVRRVLVTPKSVPPASTFSTEEPRGAAPSPKLLAGATGLPALKPAPKKPVAVLAKVESPRAEPVTKDGSIKKAAAPEPKQPPPKASTAKAVKQAKQAMAAKASGLASGYHIQIGAFGSVTEAERQLGSIRERTGVLLAKHQPVTQLVQKGERTLYRARFAGFEPSSAASACAELKKRQIECFVLKAE